MLGIRLQPEQWEEYLANKKKEESSSEDEDERDDDADHKARSKKNKYVRWGRKEGPDSSVTLPRGSGLGLSHLSVVLRTHTTSSRHVETKTKNRGSGINPDSPLLPRVYSPTSTFIVCLFVFVLMFWGRFLHVISCLDYLGDVVIGY